MKLRPYQEIIIKEARKLMIQGKKRILIQAPTGAGKTVLVAHMLKTAQSKGMSSMFIVHRRELLKQSILAFSKVGVKHGVISSGWPHNNQLPIQIASVQTLIRRLNYFRQPSLLIVDECQHSAAGSWNKIHKHYPDAYTIGLSASPIRLDGKGLSPYYDVILNGPTVAELIEQSYLSKYKIFAPSKTDLSGLHTRMGDFAQEEVSQLMDKPTITGCAIEHYQKICPGKRALVFCSSIKHSNHVKEQFLNAGIKAVHIDGETDMNERDRLLRLFRDGHVQVVCSVDLFCEGFDLPVLDAVIMLRPTQSLGLFLQQVGRALRSHPDKEYAIILDHVGNVERHGLPDDEREWTLEGDKLTKKEKQEADVKVSTCPKCFAVQAKGSESCNFCGYKFEKQEREIKEVDGELIEIDYEKLRKQRRMAQGRCETKEELVEEGRKRGYKNPHRWAHYVMQARQRKKLFDKE